MRLHIGVYREAVLFHYQEEEVPAHGYCGTADRLINLFLSDIAAFVVT